MTTLTTPTTSPGSRTRLPVAILALTAGTFLMGTSEFVLAGLLTGIATDFDTSVAHAGLTITVFAVGMIVGAPSMALLTLRMPRRVTLTLALAVFGAGHLAAALTESFAMLLAARFVTAVATGAFWAVASVVAAAIAGPAGRARALGVVLAGGMLSNVLGVPLGAFAGQLVGWRGAFWGLTVAAVVMAVVTFSAVDEPARPSAPSVRAELRALRSLRLWLALATCALVTGSVLAVYSYVDPLLTHAAGLPADIVPVALLVFGAGSLIGTLVCGRLGDARPYRTALMTAAATSVAMVGLLTTAGTPFGAIVFLAALGLVGLSSNPILVALAARFGGAAPVLATALPTAIFNLGTAIGTGVAASALAQVGPLGPVVVGTVVSVFTLVPLGVLAWVDRRAPLER